MSNDNKNSDKYKVIPVEIPSDDELFYDRPFFAYGVFKKCGLCHYKISNLVDCISPDTIGRKMLIKDGIPLIVNRKSKFDTYGHKINFSDEFQVEAYERISKTLPGNIYEWDIIEIDGVDFNILVGKDARGTFLHVDENGKYMESFIGKEDPFFSKVPTFIRNELDDIEYDGNEIFRIQMYYMLLWSAIDRYCSLKYDVSNVQGDYLRALANDELFEEIIRNVESEKLDTIYSTTNGTPFYFNENRNNFIVRYLYTIRCNVVHRGKEGNNNPKTLVRALFYLLDIFDELIKRTFACDDER